MTEQKFSKLKRLEQEVPEGLLVTAAWLDAEGYSRSLRSQYLKAQWLEQPARGVFRRPRGPLKWEHVVISLQTLLETPILVGGRTALELQGYAHFLSNGLKEVHLYGLEKLPGWMQKLPLEEKFIFHNDAKLFQNSPITRGVTAFGWDLKTGQGRPHDPVHGAFNVMPWGQWEWPLTLSTPERALLQLLGELPSKESFHMVDKLVEGLVNLSPRRLQKLLVDCRSIKVKRLFFFFADRHTPAWLRYIEREQIDLGSGDRLLVRGGRFDPTYRITVPEDLDAL